MRRGSQLATRIAAALQAQGINVMGRRLERWCQEGLGPEAPLMQPNESIAHFAALAEIASSGRDADVVAMRLAARGHASPRLRLALLRRLDIAPTAQPSDQVVPDLSDDWVSEPEADPIFQEVESEAQAATSVRHPFFKKILHALLRNAQRNAGPGGDTPAQVVHSVFVNIAWLRRGGELYNSRAWADAFNASGLDDEEFAQWMEALRPNQRDLEEEYRRIPLRIVAAIAAWLVASAPGFLNHIGAFDVPDAELEEWCCLFAPQIAYAVALLQPKMQHFGLAECDLPEVFRDYLRTRDEC